VCVGGGYFIHTHIYTTRVLLTRYDDWGDIGRTTNVSKINSATYTQTNGDVVGIGKIVRRRFFSLPISSARLIRVKRTTRDPLFRIIIINVVALL